VLTSRHKALSGPTNRKLETAERNKGVPRSSTDAKAVPAILVPARLEAAHEGP
jgi:hypothetical protein